MPFTPFHLGPGLAIKALGGHRISLLVFAGTQVLMDIEPLLGLLGLIDSLHGVSHSLAGALLIALLATLTGRPIGNRMLRVLRWPAHARHPARRPRTAAPGPAAASGRARTTPA